MADNSQYQNQEAWSITPLSSHQKKWPTTPNTQIRRHDRQLHYPTTLQESGRIVYYPAFRRSGRQLSISKPGGMPDNSTIRPPERVADNSQYPNMEAWPTTPLPGHQKEWSTTPNTQTRGYDRQLHYPTTLQESGRVVFYPAIRRSGWQLQIPKHGGMADNSTIRPPKGVANISQYPNQEACPITPLSDHQKEWPTTSNTQTRRHGRQLLIPKPGGMADNSLPGQQKEWLTIPHTWNSQ